MLEYQVQTGLGFETMHPSGSGPVLVRFTEWMINKIDLARNNNVHSLRVGNRKRWYEMNNTLFVMQTPFE